jgi:UDP-N-acetylmuramoyl-L-alanyl-D-glutamate--2,6-diaminopimelate ligase
MESRLPGPHNAFNLVAALAAAEGIGVPREVALETLAVAEPIPGRLQPIREGQPFDAIVDFAHTPDAVRQVLLTIRRVLRDRRRGRLIAVIGVIGGGDPSKRPPLGRITRELADVAVLSSGAPAAETPEAIAAGLAEGARRAGGGRFEVVPPRRAAIERAVELARPGDIVMVLGRGSMRSMKVSREGAEVDFDDREVLREVLRSRQSS